MKRTIDRGIVGLVLAATLFATGCVSKTAKQTLEAYNETYQRVQALEQAIATADFDRISGEELAEIYNIGRELYYSFNPMDLKPEQIAACEALQSRVSALRETILTNSNETMAEFAIYPYTAEDSLMEKATTFPVYLLKGETLKVDISAAKPVTVRIINANSNTLIKSIAPKSCINEVMEIKNTAIYLVEINPNGAQYLDYKVYYKVTDMSRLTNATPISTEQVECSKGDLGATAVPGISMHQCFEEPRKFTLRGQLKAAFSGNAKALVAVQIPSGTTDILYSMRIDTSESSRSEDGEFHDNLTRSYKRVKFLGLPLYEKTNSNGLLNTLLDDNRPLRDEDAYCNMYVFRNQTQAKQFQDGTKSASQLSYDVDYSTIGTQSCNGRIPTKGAKTIYLAFENERMRYTNYLWIEVEAVVPNTVYYRTKYSINQ